jgi:outer membrane protein OmpA-like peptidoglycan-associated protein/septal ring factor EnvC (AmiA/AmiB activator)
MNNTHRTKSPANFCHFIIIIVSLSLSASGAWATHPKTPDELNREIAKLKSELDASRHSFQKADGELKNCRAEVEHLKREKADLEKARQESDARNAEKIKSLEEQLRDCDGKKKMAEQRASTAEAEVARLKSDLANSQKATSSAMQTIDSLKAKISELERRIQESEKGRNDVQAQYNAAQSEIARINEELKKALTANASLEDTLKKTSTSRDEISKALEESKKNEQGGDQLRRQLEDELKAKNDEVNRCVENLKAANQSLESTRAQAAKRITELENSLKNSADAICKKDEEFKKLQALQATDAKTLCTLETEFKNTKAELERRLAECGKHVAELESANSEMKISMARENGAAEELRTQRSSMEELTKTLSTAREQMLIELGSAREIKLADTKQIADLQLRLNSKENDTGKMAIELQSQIAQRDEKLGQMNRESEKLRIHLSELEMALSKSGDSEAQKAAEARAKDLAAQLAAGKEQHDAAVAHAASLDKTTNAELAKIRAAYESLKAERRRHSIDPILFEKNACAITGAHSRALGQVKTVLRDNPNVSFDIIGHASAEGGEETNMQLSANRARIFSEFLQRHGIAKEKLTLQAAGGTQPVADNSLEEGRQLNRRVEILVGR